MRDYFGLEVNFANTRRDRMHSDRWPTHKNFRWHDEELKTTLCYLTVPLRMGPQSRYEADEYENEAGEVSLDCAQAVRVDVPSAPRVDRMQRQFQCAMRTLALQPYEHPSQKHGEIVSLVNGDTEGDGKEADECVSLSREANSK